MAFVLIFIKEPERKTNEQKSSTSVTEQVNHTDNNNSKSKSYVNFLNKYIDKALVIKTVYVIYFNPNF